MKIYGYAENSDILLELEEVTIQASIDEINKIIEFFTHTKMLMEDNPDTFGHEHLLDFCELKTNSDIILIR
ncbi:hypothetical protein HYE60_07490 [Aggregatibacter actinomycetemcomitans]|uniref:hypothetical protein n=1 Tax=Aggregatibacter actinomycetemcomitans TaxID=714 RepID=UPI00197B1618|nr:hypothetical protein [Aggregatibacter actinomycetemcomitans]MBN6075085.1 hypothetical protein [Aggregatibacter actinomycetemcomitans]